MQYFISDIHGHYDLFCRLMEKIKFCGGDTLYVLGDMIDKGPHSVRLLRLLFSQQNVFCIAGNHEYNLIKYYHALMRQTEDYDYVLRQLGERYEDRRLLDWDTVDKLETLPYFIEENFIAVHAGVPLQNGKILPLSQAMREQLVYDRDFLSPHCLPEGKCVLFGHTPTRSVCGRDGILMYPRGGKVNTICDCIKIHLDTGVYLGGVLGCVSFEGKCFYVKQ